MAIVGNNNVFLIFVYSFREVRSVKYYVTTSLRNISKNKHSFQ